MLADLNLHATGCCAVTSIYNEKAIYICTTAAQLWTSIGSTSREPPPPRLCFFWHPIGRVIHPTDTAAPLQYHTRSPASRYTQPGWRAGSLHSSRSGSALSWHGTASPWEDVDSGSDAVLLDLIQTVTFLDAVTPVVCVRMVTTHCRDRRWPNITGCTRGLRISKYFRVYFNIPSKYGTSTQYLVNVGPASWTLNQHRYITSWCLVLE